MTCNVQSPVQGAAVAVALALAVVHPQAGNLGGGGLAIGDLHYAQGDGEVCGTGIEAPMRLVLEVNVRKGGRSIPEPEYETDEFYATMFERMTSEPFDGRPHWAKLLYDMGAVKRRYGSALDEFESVRARWDPDGRFLNPFLRDVFGLGSSAPER